MQLYYPRHDRVQRHNGVSEQLLTSRYIGPNDRKVNSPIESIIDSSAFNPIVWMFRGSRDVGMTRGVPASIGAA